MYSSVSAIACVFTPLSPPALHELLLAAAILPRLLLTGQQKRLQALPQAPMCAEQCSKDDPPMLCFVDWRLADKLSLLGAAGPVVGRLERNCAVCALHLPAEQQALLCLSHLKTSPSARILELQSNQLGFKGATRGPINSCSSR